MNKLGIKRNSTCNLNGLISPMVYIKYIKNELRLIQQNSLLKLPTVKKVPYLLKDVTNENNLIDQTTVSK